MALVTGSRASWKDEEFAPDSATLHESEERSLHGNGDLISPLIKLRLKEVREQKLKFNQMLQMMEEEL